MDVHHEGVEVDAFLGGVVDVLVHQVHQVGLPHAWPPPDATRRTMTHDGTRRQRGVASRPSGAMGSKNNVRHMWCG